MRFMTHLVSGLLMYVLLIIIGFEYNLPALLLFTVGSVVPDVDIEYSPVGKRVPGSKFINALFGHRGAIHSLLGGVLLSLILALLLRYMSFSGELAVWFFGGYLIHLLLDSLNPTGVNWFYPFSKRRRRHKIRTGSHSELAFLALVFILLAIALWTFFLNL